MGKLSLLISPIKQEGTSLVLNSVHIHDKAGMLKPTLTLGNLQTTWCNLSCRTCTKIMYATNCCS